ncbi:c-type cytochrome [Paenibacillus eucommiae]|uniref:Cytochrome c551 n=1 Tax=Paenibacillus eucommiae TaxID=1355755 RepID=A0ABS4JAV3_9BACL|nr:cytochrome c [Paenibacillus eucommiae]MBP1996376.1 cytochrome c551 [Paenibacillus eucommiae]
MKRIRVIVASCFLITALGTAGCGANSATGDQTSQTPVTDIKVVSEQGMELYKANCIACHGVDLEGKVGPDLRKVGERKTKSQIAGQIRDGGGKMPAYNASLSKEDIETLAGWLASLK